MIVGESFEAADGRVYRMLDCASAEVVAELLRSRACEGMFDFGRGLSAPDARPLLFLGRSRANFIRTIHDPVSGRLEGVVGIMGLDNLHGVATIWGARPVLRPPARSTAVSQIRAACQWVFGNTSVRAIQAWAVQDNAISVRTLLRAGFTATGRHRSAHVRNGRRLDRLLFDITADDFFSTHAREHHCAAAHLSEVTSEA